MTRKPHTNQRLSERQSGPQSSPVTKPNEGQIDLREALVPRLKHHPNPAIAAIITQAASRAASEAVRQITAQLGDYLTLDTYDPVLWLSKFGQIVRERRKALKMTQGELAEAIDIRQSHLSQLERGRVEPRLSTIYAIAVALRDNPGRMLGEVLTKT